MSPDAGAPPGRRPSLEFIASPKRGRRRGSRLLHFLVISLVFYAAWCGLLYLVQDSILFPAEMAMPPRIGGPPEGVIVLRREIEDGQSVEGWLYPAIEKGEAGPAPLAVLFHGNAEVIDHQNWHVEHYRNMGYAVFLPEYRGYGRAGGSPSQRGIVEDSAFLLDEVLKRTDIHPEKVIFHGWSIGGAIAAQVAAKRPPQGMILQSTPASVAEMAWRYGAPGFLVKNPFRTVDALKAVPRRALIIHGLNDSIVPVSHAHRLAAASPLTTYAEFPAGHNDLPNPDQEANYWLRIQSFLNELEPQRRIASPWRAPQVGRGTAGQTPDDKSRPTLLKDP